MNTAGSREIKKSDTANGVRIDQTAGRRRRPPPKRQGHLLFTLQPQKRQSSMVDLPPEHATRRQPDRLDELEALVRLLSDVNGLLDVEPVLQFSLAGIQRVVGGTFGCFLLIQPNTLELELAEAASLPPPLLNALQNLTASPGVMRPTQDLADYVVILSTLARSAGEILKAQGHDFISVPLTSHRKPIGLMVTEMNPQKVLVSPSPDGLAFIGEQVGRAIENAQRYESLRASGDRYRIFMEKSPDGFWEGDPNGGATFINDAACQITGFTRDELKSMRPADLVVEPERKDALIQKLISEGHIENEVVRIRTKAGEIKTVRATARLIRSGLGDSQTAFREASFRDITEQQDALEELRQRNRELNALNTIAEILSHPLEIETAFDQVCEQVTSVTGMEGAAICFMNETRQSLQLLAHRGIDTELFQQTRRIGLDDPFTQCLMVQGEAIVVNNIAEYPESVLAGPRAAGFCAGIAAPIKSQGQPIGALFVGTKLPRTYNTADERLIVNIAHQIAVAATNADLYTQMQRRLQELDGLARFSAACSVILDPLRISDLAVEVTQKLLQVDVCSLRRLEGESARLVSVRTHRDGIVLEERIPIVGVIRSVVEKRIPFFLNDVKMDAVLLPQSRQALAAHGLLALVLVPLLSHDRVIGLLDLIHTQRREWSPREIDILQTIATQTANALDNAQLFQNVLTEQRKVQAIFDSGLSGMFVTDAQGRFVMFNRAAERITGWTRDEVLGRRWEEVFADSSGAHTQPLVYEALERGRTVFRQEGRTIQTRDHGVIPVAKAIAPLLNDKGEIDGVVGAFWDLSREKAGEISRANFLRMVAHELRDPLAVIISALDLLDSKKLSAKKRAQLLTQAKSEGQRLMSFSQQFLDRERVSSGTPVSREPLPVVTTVSGVVRRFRATHTQHRFRFHAVQTELLIDADRYRLDIVLRNLLDNAVNYSPSGSQIVVSVTMPNEETVDVAVHDQGPGIPDEYRERIFDEFYRGEQPNGQRAYGHGLGLAIAVNRTGRCMPQNGKKSNDAGGWFSFWSMNM